jgi:hypothetical protein
VPEAEEARAESQASGDRSGPIAEADCEGQADRSAAGTGLFVSLLVRTPGAGPSYDPSAYSKLC